MSNVRAIHQIEITSRCNLRCRYCAHPKMPRAKQDMDRATFWAAVNHASDLNRRFGTRELNLAGIGESTMHPEFIEYVHLARSVMGWDVRLVLATNGVSLTEEQAKELKRSRVDVWVSLHRPEKAGPAIELLKKYGVLNGVSADPSISAVDWAGQVQWHVSAQRSPCPWIPQQWAFVMSDGRVGTCCFDAQGEDGVIGHVSDPIEKWNDVKPYSLCEACHLDLPKPVEEGELYRMKKGPVYAHV